MEKVKVLPRIMAPRFCGNDDGSRPEGGSGAGFRLHRAWRSTTPWGLPAWRKPQQERAEIDEDLVMRILIIDDDRALCRSLQIHLEREGHGVTCAYTGEEGLTQARNSEFALLFVDLNLPDASGLDILKELGEQEGCPLMVMITGVQDARSTISAIRLGAFDYIRKPLDLDAVMVTLEKAAKHLATVTPQRTESIAAATDRPHEMVGASPALIEVLKQVALVSETRVPVLINGESGTGKELVARALHETSTPDLPFIAVNCSAVVATLLESELFGHVKGAFTGADADRAGKLEAAGGGTLFLDEIGDMSYDLQAKLLRVLQEKEFERVGSTRPIKFRARVVAATHRDLRGMVEKEGFREDLYYRLAVSTIHVPALRERRSDIPLLVEHMLARIAQELHKNVSDVSEAAINRCLAYDWPGNVRELSNVLTRAVLLARGPAITEELIARSMGESAPDAPPAGPLKSLREVEEDCVFRTLLSTGWNITKTAEILDISRVTLRKKIEDYGLVRPATVGSGRP